MILKLPPHVQKDLKAQVEILYLKYCGRETANLAE
jgi:hypothetical protein